LKNLTDSPQTTFKYCVYLTAVPRADNRKRGSLRGISPSVAVSGSNPGRSTKKLSAFARSSPKRAYLPTGLRDGPEPSQQHGGDHPLENRIYELRRRVEEQCRALGSIASSIEDRLELMISSIVDSYRTFLSRNHQLKPCTHFMAFKPTVACLPGKIT
jgi:hypothetical protein